MIQTYLLAPQIISKDLSDPVRSHKDLDKDATAYFRKAVQFYEELAKQLVSHGHVLNLFASALDQPGACFGPFCICKLLGYLENDASLRTKLAHSNYKMIVNFFCIGHCNSYPFANIYIHY